MKKLSRLVFVFFSASILFYCFSWNAIAGGPRLVLEEKEFDFGRVYEGVVLTHSFKIKNEGDGPLKIIRVNPG